jgi:prepilin signal peptidase PulO-like enzyme (type II secretory pathway)
MILPALIPTWLLATFGALLGAVLASFSVVVAERLPRGESVGGRSHCICGRQLSWWENVPIVGWVAARGTARCCGATIPAHYVIAEAAASVVTGAAFALLPLPAATVAAVVTQGAVLWVCWAPGMSGEGAT